jgi:hypothetical protein
MASGHGRRKKVTSEKGTIKTIQAKYANSSYANPTSGKAEYMASGNGRRKKVTSDKGTIKAIQPK